MKWNILVGIALTIAMGMRAWAYDPDASVWSPRDGLEWVRQARALADVAVRGTVVGAAEMRVRDDRGHVVNLLCLTIEINRVYFYDVEVDRTVDVCATNSTVATPELVRRLAPGDEIITFARRASSGRLRVVLNRTIMLADMARRAARTADLDFLIDVAVVEREMEADQ